MSVTELLLSSITHVISVFGYPGVFVSMALESACIPLPSFVIMPFAGKLIVDGGGFNLWVLTFVGALGNLAGSMLAYWVGAVGGRPFIEKYGKYILLTKADMDTADKWFGTYGEATAFFSRLLPVIRTFISLPAGISRMNFGKFCVYTFIGALPYCFALTYAGMKLGEHWIEVSKVLHKADAVILGILAVFFALWVYRHIRGSQASASRKS